MACTMSDKETGQIGRVEEVLVWNSFIQIWTTRKDRLGETVTSLPKENSTVFLTHHDMSSGTHEAVNPTTRNYTCFL